MRNVSGTVAFVTGGAQGLGLGLAQALLRRGARVAIADVRRDALEQALEQTLCAHRDDIMAVELDVRDAAAWEEAARSVEKTLGPVDVLCNNAGVNPARPTLDNLPVDEITLAEWDWTVTVNLTGPFLGMRTFLPRMKARESPAHILTTASMASLKPFPSGVPAAYTASKFGLFGLCEQVRLELSVAGHDQIGMSVICPDMMNTAIFRNTLLLSPQRNSSAEERARYEAYLKTLPDTHSRGIDPMVFGEQAIQAMLDGQVYIFSASDQYPVIAERNAALLAVLETAPQLNSHREPLPKGFSWDRNHSLGMEK
jgi:NAD(P)-dependent dehydrogenase (short-subunit alcohol dehydrogenase family)